MQVNEIRCDISSLLQKYVIESERKDHCPIAFIDLRQKRAGTSRHSDGRLGS